MFPGLSGATTCCSPTGFDDRSRGGACSPRRLFEIFPVLKGAADANASTMSGGEQKMLSLASRSWPSRSCCSRRLSLGLSPAVVGELIEIVKSSTARHQHRGLEQA